MDGMVNGNRTIGVLNFSRACRLVRLILPGRFLQNHSRTTAPPVDGKAVAKTATGSNYCQAVKLSAATGILLSEVDSQGEWSRIANESHGITPGYDPTNTLLYNK